LQAGQNTLIKIALNKEKTHQTKHLYEDFNVLNIKNLNLKSAGFFLKKHDVPLALNHNIDTRFAKNNNYKIQ